MDSLPKEPLQIVPWAGFDYRPEVSFTLSYSTGCLLLKFYITEEAVRAAWLNTHDPVYKDTCVEFFVAFDNQGAYYNFEFNCIGTCLAGFGTNSVNRILLPEGMVNKIKSHTSLTMLDSAIPGWSWDLTLIMPFEIFCHHQIRSLKNTSCRLNFYKCGDDLPRPHYLVWNNIKSDKPDFHLPEFFGLAEFT